MMFFCQHVCLNKVLRHFNGRITLKKAHHRMIQEYKQEKKNTQQNSQNHVLLQGRIVFPKCYMMMIKDMKIKVVGQNL